MPAPRTVKGTKVNTSLSEAACERFKTIADRNGFNYTSQLFQYILENLSEIEPGKLSEVIAAAKLAGHGKTPKSA